MQIRPKITKFKIPECQYLIIDTDAGCDDIQSIMLSISQAKRTKKTILGITCVDGNTSVQCCAINVLITLSMCEAHIPVFIGAQKGMMEKMDKDNYFGEDGAGGRQQQYVQNLKKQNKYLGHLLQQKKAQDFIVQSINKYPKQIGYISLGPLTNLALAYHMDYSIVDKIALVSIMGGSISSVGMNQQFSAEFNFNLDYVAAKIVIDVFHNVIMSTLDVTFKNIQKFHQLFQETTRPKAKLINDIFTQILKTHIPYLCDPITNIPIFSPQDILYIHQGYAQVQIGGKRTKGCLLWNWLNKEDIQGKNKIIAIGDVDLERFVGRVDLSYN